MEYPLIKQGIIKEEDRIDKIQEKILKYARIILIAIVIGYALYRLIMLWLP